MSHATPSQTVGPFFSIGCSWLQREDLAPGAADERVTLQGRVTDGDGAPVPDAMFELWQADARGRYGEPGFAGFGRVPTDADGRYRFTTIKPGGAPGPRGTTQAPHIAVSLFARGLMRRLVTRIYFPDEPANASDPVLENVAAARRGTLIARKGSGQSLEWNVVLQGAGETVFFDCF